MMKSAPIASSPLNIASFPDAAVTQRVEPIGDVPNAFFQDLGVLSGLCKRDVTLVQRDETAGSLTGVEVATDRALGLPSRKRRGDGLPPDPELSRETLAKLLVQGRHLLGQIVQGP